MKSKPQAINLARRQAIKILGAGGLAVLSGRSLAEAADAPAASSVPKPSCMITPQQTEGPYFSDLPLNRADIRSDPGSGKVVAGTPLQLQLRISEVNAGTCTPLSNARVDIWHCDANGIYSDVQDPRFDTTGEKFLRGYQISNAKGRVQFTTIYPGWYPGRTVHIHFKVRAKTKTGETLEFTSQLYFDDAVTDSVYQQGLYASRNPRYPRNNEDGIYSRGGANLMLKLTPAERGYRGTLDVGMYVS